MSSSSAGTGFEEPASRTRTAGAAGRHGAYVGPLEGLRGMMAIAVVLVHVGIYTGQVASGWLGIPRSGALGVVLSRFTLAVPVFFAIAGLLLYRSFADAALDGRRLPAVRPYLWRRALRILPAYWALCLVALVFFGTGESREPWPVVRTVLLLQIYEPRAIPVAMPQTWSLATEVSFYLALPLLAAGLSAWASRAGRGVDARAARLLAGLGGLVLLDAGYVALTHLPAAGPYPVQAAWLPAYVGYCAAGMALAVLAGWTQRSGERAAVRLIRRHPRGLRLAGLTGFAVACSPLTGETIRYQSVGQALLQYVLFLLCAVALVAPAAFAERPAPVLSSRPARWVGRVSYSLYLWHMVVLEAYFRVTGGRPGHGSFLTVSVVTLSIGLVVAAGSHLLLERPARRLRPWVGGPPDVGAAGLRVPSPS